MSEHTCTCCGTELPLGAPVTVIASAYVADWGEIIECDCPNQETLCENCAGRLDSLLIKQGGHTTTRSCVSCHESIEPDEHSHECIDCKATLCNFCFSASAQCPTCEAKEVI